VTDVRRVALAARVFTIAALAAIATLLDNDVRDGVLPLVVVAAAAQVVSLTRRLPEGWIVLAEGAAVAAVAAAANPGNDAVLPYLAIPALVAGLADRMRGVLRVLIAEAAVLLVAFNLVGDVERVDAGRAVMWLVTGLGLGFLGASMRRLVAESETVTSYRGAVDLIKQLHKVSNRLTDGLEVPAIADALLAELAQEARVRSAALYATTAEGAVTALRYAPGTTVADLGDALRHAERAWWSRQPVRHGTLFALPLMRDSQVLAVLVGVGEHTLTDRELREIEDAIAPETLKLHAALLFAEIRRTATQEERHRLAREVHDGIAQDVASLGYLLDTVTPTGPDQEHQLDKVRGEIRRVVNELRHSVFDLRHDVGGSRGLGESLSTIAQHIGARSTMAVHVSLDEANERLSPDVEAQLVRIAQEAMNNARKHADAANLWLRCRVAPPAAEVEIADDGRGLGERTADSHGLQIMHERAERIDAELEITSPTTGRGGTRVVVRLPARVG
jgi:signal transduction histidine kinase